MNLKFLKRNEFAKNALTLTIGTSVAQFLPFLFYPILGRIFSPDDFGLLATISSITAICVTLSTGKYEFSILIAESKQDAANIIGLVLLISFSFCLLLLVFFFLLSSQFSVWFNTPALERWVFIIPFSVFSIVIYNCYNEWCVRNKYFKSLSWNKIINASAIASSKLIFGLLNFLNGGLILGDLLGRLISAFGCVFRALHKDKEVFLKISLSSIKKLAYRYSNFPKFNLPAQLLNTIGGQLPIILIGVFFDRTQVGYYSMTASILSVPISVISLAIRDTFRQRAYEDYTKKGECRNLYVKTFKPLFYITAIATLSVYFFLPKLFLFVLGSQWETAGVYSQILLPMIALSFLSNSLGGVLIVTEKLKISMYWQIYYVSIIFISLYLSSTFSQDIKIVLLFYSLGLSTAYIIQMILSYKYAKK